MEELSIHAPDVFLISSGGNDLVGGNRLATLVRVPLQAEAIAKTKEHKEVWERELSRKVGFPAVDIPEAIKKLKIGRKYLNVGYYRLLKTFLI